MRFYHDLFLQCILDLVDEEKETDLLEQATSTVCIFTLHETLIDTGLNCTALLQ